MTDEAALVSDAMGPSHRVLTLPDIPAPEDAFGGHKRVASAIRETLKEPGGRTIGLEGDWGSGKSTIVGLVCRDLGSDYRAFVYDAWAHEGDPLRRSFLEALINFLIAEKWIDQAHWRMRIEELARRRRTTKLITKQTLTRNGKWLSASVFLVPVGLALLNYSLGHKLWMIVLGSVFSLAPLILAVVFLLEATVLHKGHRRSEIQEHDANSSDDPADDDPDDPLTILAKVGKTIQETNTIETPEPTSIEFSEKFNELVSEALSIDKRRLLIVLDNLDRVSTEEALKVLSTLQIFIGTSSARNDSWRSALWMILPYDREGLVRLWPDRAIADEFLTKVTQVRFEVPPLVLSDWRNYLLGLLAKALPDTERDELDTVVLIFAAVRMDPIVIGTPPADKSPTPRQLIQFVNDLGAVYRQRQDIPLEQLAYYVYMRRLNIDIRAGLLAKRIPSERMLGLLGDSIQTNLAALSFNVEIDSALQLLLSDPVSAALVGRDVEAVKLYETNPGFWAVIENLPFEDWAGTGGGRDLAYVGLTLSDANLIDQMTVGARWAIRAAIERTMTWQPESKEVGEGLSIIFLGSGLSPSQLKVALNKYSEQNKELVLESANLRGRIAGLVATLGGLRNNGHDELCNTARIYLPGVAAQFLLTCGLLAKADPEGLFWHVPRSSDSAANITNEIKGWAGCEPDEAHSLDAIKVLIVNGAGGNWPTVADAFSVYLRDASLPFSPAIALALGALDVLPTSPGEGDLTQLADEGWFLHYFVLAGDAGDIETAALAAYFQLKALPAIPEPPTMGKAPVGAQRLREWLSDVSANQEFDNGLTSLCVSKMPSLPFEVAASSPASEPWAVECIRGVVEAGIDAETVAARWPILTRALDSAALDRLLETLMRNDFLLIATGAAQTEDQIEIEIRVLPLLAADPTLMSPQSTLTLKQNASGRLRTMNKDEWFEEFKTDGPCVELLRLLNNDEADHVNLSVNFQEAIILHGSALARGEVSVADPETWPVIVTALRGDQFQRAAAKGLCQPLSSLTGPINPAFFDAYGKWLAAKWEALAAEPFFTSVLTAAVRSRDLSALAWATQLFTDHSVLLDSLKSTDNLDSLRSLAAQAVKDEDPPNEVLNDFTRALGVKLTK